MSWIFLTAFYGLAKGARELLKKKALQRFSVTQVLVAYTLLSFLWVLPTLFIPALGGGLHRGGEGIFEVDWHILPYIAVKTLMVFGAWVFGFMAIDKMPVSLFGVLELSRVLFSTLLGVVFLRESVGGLQALGLFLVCLGLFLLKKAGENPGSVQEQQEKSSYWLIVLAFLSCFLNASSGTIDKVLMRYVNSAQMQFWFMLFISLFYFLYALIRRMKWDWRLFFGNWYIPLLSLIFVLGDRAAFMANAVPESKVTVMTLLKQCGCVLVILGGKVFFGEKNIGRKLLCAAVVIAGIVLSVL